MPTILQERLAGAIIKNAKASKPKHKQALLESVGYGKGVARAEQKRTFEQKGLAIALQQKGFSIDGAKAVVQSIMYSPKTKDENKLRACSEVFKVMGGYAPEKHENINKTLIITTVLDTLEGKISAEPSGNTAV